MAIILVSVLLLANYNNPAFMLAFCPNQSLTVCCKEKNVSVNFLFEFHSNMSLLTFYVWSNFPVMFINLIFSQHLFHMRTSTIIRDQLLLVHFPQLAGEPSLLTDGKCTIQHISLHLAVLYFRRAAAPPPPTAESMEILYAYSNVFIRSLLYVYSVPFLLHLSFSDDPLYSTVAEPGYSLIRY